MNDKQQNVLARGGDSLAIALHVHLLNVGREAQQSLAVWQQGTCWIPVS